MVVGRSRGGPGSEPGHSHGHSHGAGLAPRRLAWVVLVAWCLCAFQLVGAWVTGSVALLFDTVHVATDAIGVSVALVALQTCVAEHFEVSIEHSTFQLEPLSLQSSDHYENLP